MNKLKKLTQQQLFLPVFCMFLVLCVNIIYDVAQGNEFYNFFKITLTNDLLTGRIINILNRGGEVAILAIGMTLVVSASAGTDISVGSVMSLCASFCCMLVAGFGVSSVNSADEFAMPLAVGLIGALLMGCLCGAFNGTLVALDCMLLAYRMSEWGLSAPVMVLLVLVLGVVFGLVQGYCVGYLQIQPFIVTMAGMFFARGMTAVISTNQLSITAEINQLFYDVANFRIYLPAAWGYANKKGIIQVPYIGIGVVVALVVLVVIFLVLRYTKFGRSLYAVGGSEQSAAMMGLDVKKTKLKAYVLSSFLCSIGGICYCMNTMSASVSQATGMEMDAISSAVIGGTLLTGGVGNVIGTLFGVLINGTISTIVQTNGKLASSWPNILTAALLCFFIILQSIFAKLKEKSK